MRATSLLKSFGIVAVMLGATSLGAGAGDDVARGRSNDLIKSRPVTASNDARKYRPKLGCFATGTQDTSGNSQTVC
jgi:hypothetical protein